MSNIEKEIDAVADQLEKSTKTPKEILFDTIRELGPEGVKAKLPTLEKSEKELLIDALQEMTKAVSMDKDYAAKYVQGNINDTKLQEDKADDDQDEKLVKPEAAVMNHQGTPTEGWEGQVIKGKMDREKAKEKIMEMEEKEHDEKDPKKLVEAEKKEHKKQKEMKKGSDMDMDKMKESKKKVKSGDKEKMKEGLKEMKKAVEDHFGEAATPELVKGEMKKLLAEEDQNGDAPDMNEKTRANKESVPALEMSKDSKDAQKKVDENKQGQMKKAVWSGENDLIKAMTGGRNYHFSMEEYINEVLKEKPVEQAELKKSEGKEDLNDIIAKGCDCSAGHAETEKLMKENKKKVNGKIVKSFEDDEIAQALGLSPEEAKKILG